MERMTVKLNAGTQREDSRRRASVKESKLTREAEAPYSKRGPRKKSLSELSWEAEEEEYKAKVPSRPRAGMQSS